MVHSIGPEHDGQQMVRQLKGMVEQLLWFILRLQPRYKNLEAVAYLLDQDAQPGELDRRLKELREKLATAEHARRLKPAVS